MSSDSQPSESRATARSECPPSRIGAEDLHHYREHGYVVVRGLFDAEALDRFKQRFRAITHKQVEAAEGMLVMRDVMVAKGLVQPSTPEEAIYKVQDFENDPVLFGYSKDRRLLDCVEAIIGSDILTIHTMLINKPPNVDGRHPLHQDIIYFPFRPAENIVGTWTALEPVTRANGCLVGIPGTHRSEILEHETPDWGNINLAFFGIKGIGADERRVHFELEPGDSVFFHPHLIHGSGSNRTAGFRRSILTHYAGGGCSWTWPDANLRLRPYRLVRGQWHGPSELMVRSLESG
jgi:phytanoyl-CoA hydroxylase